MAAKAKKKVYAKFQCASCKEINYFLHKSKKAMEEKLELKKFCNSCRAHKKHKEAKR
ncbi:MAG: 50S ribosomal protein L33 [Candidatus Wildermuthbacteria bacterium RIFCSPHIGHO2_01_FULL_45_20]|uniref:Large ribosomal subunit protein bL33 n=1 Tax=Candidatus Wildermuthbacteria bacterium RIFCSPHIGHO2_02_FULL_45_25 TaxID=1802450 RepID=A0A1G2R0U3_9BACT|nr:MAG: 50S ribosomal protein L33 [Candidatus Wildermuthbacteria bacterium RIFCSPHIGHO2_01_FULL_45_20]OHA66440.1 MAG: 50S ribosomal protein L33 [Candidatus Wildermuthbacteria bacterium RIFCSPHIGHO2_02_FULL_45_25]